MKEGPPEGRHATAKAVVFALFGIAVITLGGDLVAHGASGLVSSFGVPAALIGMVVTPAVIEGEEVIRQAVPAKMGRPDIAAGNLVGTVLYFTLFNLGLIALITPVAFSNATRVRDFPFAVGTALDLARGPVRCPSARLRREAVTAASAPGFSLEPPGVTVPRCLGVRSRWSPQR